MREIQRWFGWLVVIGPVHIGEQLLFGIDELAEIKRFLAVYYGWFRHPDYGTVVLVGITVTSVMLMVYGLLLGGRWRFIVTGFFGVVGVTELHHIVKTFLHGAYFPGAVTAIPFVVVGFLLLRAAIREYQNTAYTYAAPR